MLIGLMISSNNCNNINCDDNSNYSIIYNTCNDFIYKFKNLRFSNDMYIMIMYNFEDL